MPVMAVVFPILPGKTPEWRTWMDELNGPRRSEFEASRRDAGVRERTFLQKTPMGDLVIVTIEGDDPGASFAKVMGAKNEFTTWFNGRAKEIHGFDPSAVMSGPPSELVADTEKTPVLA
jgi:hypothetical protein